VEKILEKLAVYFEYSNFGKMSNKEVASIIRNWQAGNCICARYWQDEYVKTWTCPAHDEMSQEYN